VLKNKANGAVAEAGEFVVVEGRKVLAINGDGPLIHACQAAHEIEHGGLSAATTPNESNKAAFFYGPVGVFEDDAFVAGSGRVSFVCGTDLDQWLVTAII
jgi:3-phosphoglycerate kinase